MPQRHAPQTWITDGECDWIGRLVDVRADGKAVVVNAIGGRVIAAWTPWEAPPRVLAVRCADCDRPVAGDDLVRADNGRWLCSACEHAGARLLV